MSARVPGNGTRPPLPALLAGSVAGIGLLPGPCATYASFAVAAVLWAIGGPWTAARMLLTFAAIAAASAATVWSSNPLERSCGSDPHAVVMDEVAGMLLGALLIPWDPLHLAAAFALFRVFDVLKPPPVYQLQSLRAGWGILADDLAAGVYTLAVIAAAAAIIPGF